MADDSTRTVLVALGAGIGVTLAKVGAAVLTGSSAMAAEASHSLADNANDLSLFIAQRRSSCLSDSSERHVRPRLTPARLSVLASVASQ